MSAPNTTAPTATVRMYNVGFGDCFLVTVEGDGAVWRMLIDCGVHSHGRARPIEEVIDAVIADLDAATPAGTPPALDVVVATHHHADHIRGFASDEWERVQVAEVWLPYVENPRDPDAAALRHGLALAADHIAQATDRLGLSRTTTRQAAQLGLARELALNSFTNSEASARLLGKGKQFLNQPELRFLPHNKRAKNVIETGIPGVTVHVLGPSRDPAQLKRMNPPAASRWLTLEAALSDSGGDGDAAAVAPVKNGTWPRLPRMFDAQFEIEAETALFRLDPELVKAWKSLKLDQNITDVGEVLSAASVLERSVNNTSLFFVIDVAGTRLVFVGDSQQGAWEHVLNDAEARALVTEPAFYKIGHHGSHNATPREYAENVIGTGGAYAMLPYGEVEQWGDIPKRNLIEQLERQGVVVVDASRPVAHPGLEIGPDGLWTQLTFPAPGAVAAASAPAGVDGSGDESGEGSGYAEEPRHLP